MKISIVSQKRHKIIKIIDVLSIAYSLIKWLCLDYLHPDNKLRVLNYHQICPTKNKYPAGISQQCISIESFSEQMKFLSAGGYNVLSVNEALRHLKTGTSFPTKAVCITFDDGYNNYYNYALPILDQFGMKATFYLATGFINKQFNWINSVKNDEDDLLFSKALSWQEILEMRNHAMEFGSHSHTHPDFSKLDSSQMNFELVESRHVLMEHLNSIEHSFVVPFGVWGKSSYTLKELLKVNGYTGAFLGKFGAITRKTNCFDLPRIIIYAEDSIKVFKRKVDGAWDWFGYAHAFYHHVRRIYKK